MPTDNVRNATELFIAGLNTASKLTAFSDFVDYEMIERLLGDDFDEIYLRDECRNEIYQEIQELHNAKH